VSPAVGGERGSVAEFRKKGVQCGDDLCALSDGRGNALDRTRAHIADREYARQVGFERPVDVCAGTRATPASSAMMLRDLSSAMNSAAFEAPIMPVF
jgi:hypothetical protein